MKEHFDRHSARLTDAEDRRVWRAMHDAAKGRRPFWKRWGLPVSALATATAALVVVAVVHQEGRTPVTRELQSPAESRDLAAKEAGEGSQGIGIHGGMEEAPSVTDEASVDTDKNAARDQDLRADKMEAEPELSRAPDSVTPPSAAKLRPAPPAAARMVKPQPVQVEMMAANEAGAKSKDSPRGGRAAAPGVVRGKITNDKGEPLAYANVVVLGTRMGAMTDTTGAFAIQGLSPGDYTLKISYLGYESEERQVTVGAGEGPLAQDFALNEADPSTMDKVVVVGERDKVRRTESSTKHAVGKEELGQLPVDTFTGAVPLKPDVSDLAAKRLTRSTGKDQDQGAAGSPASANEPPALKSGVVSQEGQFHFRDGRTGEIQYQIDGIPGSGPIAVGGSQVVNGKKFDAMFFEHYGVNPFVDTEEDRFATFAVDVDNASYALTRSYLNRGALPPKEAVRVEEFVNSFKHHYAAPSDVMVASRDRFSQHGTFAIHLEAAPSPFGQDLVLMRVGLKGREVMSENRKPANLTFVVDVSGSMGRENRLGLVKRALHLLLDQLTDEDQVALVVYGSDARTLLAPTSLRYRREIERAIDRLQPEGATNAEAGLRVGYTLAERVYDPSCINRVVLCSDGVANVGQTGAEDILSVIKRRAGEGIYMTAVGFGMGNYNDVLMEKLADKGEGNYYYVDTLAEARKVFVENLTGTLQVIARQVKTQVEFDPETVRRYRLLGYENRDVADKDFRNDKVDAGEVGAGHEVTALFEVKLAKGARRGDLATVRIRYEDPDTRKVTEEARTLRLGDVERRIENADPTFRMDAAVAEFAEILRHSYWAKDGDLHHVLGMARDASRELGRPADIEEMVQLVEKAWNLWPKKNTDDWQVRPLWDPCDEDGD